MTGPSLFQLVGDPTRERILQLIWDEEISAGDIARKMPVTFGAVSQHLGLLRDAGLVHVRREGKYRYYKADQEALGPVAEMLREMWSAKLKRLKAFVEAGERGRLAKGRRRKRLIDR